MVPRRISHRAPPAMGGRTGPDANDLEQRQVPPPTAVISGEPRP
jgi:hypothetical protein